MDLSPTRIYYVSSFCKNLNNKEMQKNMESAYMDIRMIGWLRSYLLV